MAAVASAPLRFPRAMRLKQGRDFKQLKAEGQRLARGCLLANWRPLPAGESSRLGIVTGRKLGGAVVRNRARRLLRESFRLQQHQLREPVALVLVARASIRGLKLAEVEQDFLSVMRKAGLLKQTE